MNRSGRIAVENQTAWPVSHAILFENRGGRIGYSLVEPIDRTTTIEPPSLDGSLPGLLDDLESALVEQGLFPREAHAMVETWKDSWFEEGSRLIYVVPRPAVDAVLPLHVDPVPSTTVRVFVGRIELLTPRTTQSVEEAISRHDRSGTETYGRFLGPILNRIALDSPVKKAQVDEFRKAVQASGGCAELISSN